MSNSTYSRISSNDAQDIESDAHAGTGTGTEADLATTWSRTPSSYRGMKSYGSIMESAKNYAAQEQSALEESSSAYHIAVNASWIVNWFLLFAKLFAFIVSASKAVMAALVDSVVDLVSQGILSMAERYISSHSPDYPVGRSRLEALSVIACAFIMSMASIEVIQYSSVDLYCGWVQNIYPELYIPLILYIIMLIGIVLKLALWWYCNSINGMLHSDTVDALAEDHLNDVISNTAAMVTAAIAFHTPSYWWVDPVGAIVISLIIIYRWKEIILEQVKKIVGHTASPEYIKKVEEIALDHDVRLAVDVTRVYHFGARYNVEMEIVLPGDMTVMESHDLALALQHKIESLEDVERAFVHVDHLMRDGLEHKVERKLVHSSSKRSDDDGDDTFSNTSSGKSTTIPCQSNNGGKLPSTAAASADIEIRDNNAQKNGFDKNSQKQKTGGKQSNTMTMSVGSYASTSGGDETISPTTRAANRRKEKYFDDGFEVPADDT